MIGPRVGLVVGPGVGCAVGPGADQLNPNGGAAPATNTTLTIGITDSADPVINGQNFTYAVVVTNTGAASATTVTATITLDANLTFVSAVGAGWTCGAAGQVVTCTIGSIAVGPAATITITVTAANVAGVTATTNGTAAAANATLVNGSQNTTLNFATRDATAGKYAPASAAEWGVLGLTAPTSLWNCQEAAGNLADSIAAVTLTANAAPTYQNAITGWSRKGVGFNETANQRFAVVAGTYDPSASSSTWLVYAQITSTPSVATRDVFGASGSASPRKAGVSTAPKMVDRVLGVSTAGTSDPTATGLQPMLLKYDRTNSTAVLYTVQEKIVGTYSAIVTDGVKGIGALGNSSFPGVVAYAAAWYGATAEMTDATARTMLQTLGWTIPW